MKETWERIEWVQIDPDGTETIRTGSIWCEAPSIKAQRAWWVIPDEPREGERSCICVMRASRRHRIGREMMVPNAHLRKSIPVFYPRAGRYVDPREVYSETHPASPTGGAGSHTEARLAEMRPAARPPAPARAESLPGASTLF